MDNHNICEKNVKFYNAFGGKFSTNKSIHTIINEFSINSGLKIHLNEQNINV